MKPEIPDILARVIGIAERSIDKPTGDDRRRDEIERMFEEVDAARSWPTDEPRRLVNEWTQMLMRALRILERIGPYGEKIERARAIDLARALLPHIRADLLAALEVRLQAGRGARK